MPVAERFTALGRGNGFTYCPAKVDVSQYRHWCTLSGKRSGGRDEEEIKKSLASAVYLEWNKYQMIGSASHSRQDDDPTGPDINVASAVSNTYTIDDEPIERVCLGFPGTGKRNVGAIGAAGSISELNFASRIIRMYNGDKTNEDNFVGYGIIADTAEDPDSIGYFRGVSAISNRASVELLSFTNDTRETTDTRSTDVDRTTITAPNGIQFNFICVAEATQVSANGTFGIPPEVDIVNYSRSVSAANRFASMGGSDSSTFFDGLDDEGEEVFVTVTTTENSSAQINNFTFYTY